MTLDWFKAMAANLANVNITSPLSSVVENISFLPQIKYDLEASVGFLLVRNCSHLVHVLIIIQEVSI